MKTKVPLEFQGKRIAYPKHLLWTWIFTPFFLIDLILEELLIFFPHLYNKFFRINIKNKKSCLNIRKNGFVVINKYFNQNQLEIIKDKINLLKIDLLKKNLINKKEIEGSIRFKFLIPPSKEISKIVNFPNLKNIYKSYKFKKPSITWMESLTESINMNQPIFASHPHIDSYRHQLKFVIALEDVGFENGPTEYLQRSHKLNLQLLISYFLTWIYEKKIIRGRKQFLPSNVIKDYRKKNKNLITLKRGDLFIFNSRGLHRGTEILSGSRNLLWFYFD